MRFQRSKRAGVIVDIKRVAFRIGVCISRDFAQRRDAVRFDQEDRDAFFSRVTAGRRAGRRARNRATHDQAWAAETARMMLMKNISSSTRDHGAANLQRAAREKPSPAFFVIEYGLAFIHDVVPSYPPGEKLSIT